MIRYTPAETHMCRMILARNPPVPLRRLLFEKRVNPAFTSYHGVLHLVQFTDAYHKLMANLTPQQKRRVVCVADLISDVIGRGGALKKLRNKWVAHIPDDSGLAEGALDFCRRVGLSDNSDVYHEMFICVVTFVDTVRALLLNIAGPAVKKFNRSNNVRPPHYWIDQDRIMRNARARLDGAQKKAVRELPSIQCDSLLGAAGVRLEDPGTGDSRADIFHWKDHWNRGVTRE